MTDEVSSEEALFEDEEHEISTDVEETQTAEIESEVKGETEEVTEKVVDTETETPADKEPKSVPLAALEDERRKRQALESEVNNLREKLPKSDEAPDPFEDIDAYDAHKKAEWEKNLNTEQANVRNAKINESRSKMLETVVDYDEMEAIFQIAAAKDPGLVDKMLSSESPAQFAYDSGKAYKESLLKVVPDVKTELTEEQKRNKSAVEVPNLATATAQAKNTETLEREADIEDVFADQEY